MVRQASALERYLLRQDYFNEVMIILDRYMKASEVDAVDLIHETLEERAYRVALEDTTKFILRDAILKLPACESWVDLKLSENYFYLYTQFVDGVYYSQKKKPLKACSINKNKLPEYFECGREKHVKMGYNRNVIVYKIKFAKERDG